MLPLIRLSQVSSPAVVRGFSSPGEWAMLRGNDVTNLVRFKGLILDHRLFFWRWIDEERRYNIIRPGTALEGTGWRTGTDYLIWMPHYKTLGVVCVTAGNGRIPGRVDTGALYGFSSSAISTFLRNSVSSITFYVPTVVELDLAIGIPDRSGWDEYRKNFCLGLDVCDSVC